MLQRKLATAWSVLHNRGVEEATRVSLEKAGMWWRHGGPFELGKFVGRPSPYARLDGCTFGLESHVISPSLKYLLLTGKHEAPERTLIRRHLKRTLPLVEERARILPSGEKSSMRTATSPLPSRRSICLFVARSQSRTSLMVSLPA